MKQEYQQLESNIPYEESLFWQLNRRYYKEAGVAAWSDGVVPHNMTSNTNVGKTYASLILGFLKDLAAQGNTTEEVFIVELGAGHGRLAYHILKKLDAMIAAEQTTLPPYCYVLTDIVESNLNFFIQHPQLQSYLNSGRLDVAYFDGTESDALQLRKQNRVIKQGALNTPVIAIANYFFDSIPTQLYAFKEGQVSSVGITLESFLTEGEVPYSDFLKNLKTTTHKNPVDTASLSSPFLKELLESYRIRLKDAHVMIPRVGIQCIRQLKQLSNQGLMLISMDKGFAKIDDQEGLPAPEIIRHGSVSLYVNFHAVEKYCDSFGGRTMYSSFTDQSMQLGCFLFVEKAATFENTKLAFKNNIEDFGPHDYNVLKKMIYRLVSQLSLNELITTLRLGSYDSTLFINFLPFIRKHLESVSHADRKNLAAALIHIDAEFFDINEKPNVSYEIAGLFYDLALHQDSLNIYEAHTDLFGQSADIYYNKILCYYQLRMDKKFSATLALAKTSFPDYEKFAHLDTLDLEAP